MLRLLLSGCLLLSTATVLEADNLAVQLGYPPDAKLLIVHADDVGMCHSANVATMEAFQHEMVRSGSVMVPCPWFPEIAAYAREHSDADLGLHLTLTSASHPNK